MALSMGQVVLVAWARRNTTEQYVFWIVAQVLGKVQNLTELRRIVNPPAREEATLNILYDATDRFRPHPETVQCF